MQFASPAKSKKQLEAQIQNVVYDLILARLSAVETTLSASSAVLDGVSLEELVNFAIPLSTSQDPEMNKDGILLGYKDGKLVEEHDLNGGKF